MEHFVYASSSSVYIANNELSFHEDQSIQKPIILYAATKVSNEMVAYSYSHIYRLYTTGTNPSWRYGRNVCRYT
ncbi:MAG: NAD-dependent epimerase/dehydratase family protein [Spirochaetota bacterium]